MWKKSLSARDDETHQVRMRWRASAPAPSPTPGIKSPMITTPKSSGAGGGAGADSCTVCLCLNRYIPFPPHARRDAEQLLRCPIEARLAAVSQHDTRRAVFTGVVREDRSRVGRIVV